MNGGLELIADSSRVKEEIADDDFLLGNAPSTMDQMVEEMEKEDAIQFEKPEVVPPKPKPKRAKRVRQSEEKDDDWTPSLELPTKKETVELKTFGLSSRPRRSVNYASIERGDEATAHSLVYDMGGSGKKRTKRTRDEMDENYTDDQKKNKKKNATKPSNAINKAVEQRVFKIFETELLMKVPSYTDERPLPEKRKFGCLLDNYLPIKRASGGFRRFIAWMSDEMIGRLFDFVNEYFKLYMFNDGAKTEDVVKIARAIRHAWNSLPLKIRKKWDNSARKDSLESFKLIGGEHLPLCEYPLETANDALRRKMPLPAGQKSNCCREKPYFSHINDVIQHYITSHDSVHLYGCHFCNTLFPTKGDFRVHNCDGFNAYLLKLTMENETVQSKAAYCVLSCTDCGLWFPLRTKSLGQKCWPYYSALIIGHTCATFVPVLIFFAEEISEAKAIEKMKFSVLPQVKSSITVDCKECEIESFSSVSEMNDHFKSIHPDQMKKCTRCGEVHYCDYSYRQHMLTHYNNSMVLANYLKNTATYYPPPGSNRLLHCGFNKENVQVGGFDAKITPNIFTEKDSVPDFVRPDEDTIRAKLKNVMVNEEKNSDTSDSSSNYSESSTDSGSSSASGFSAHEKPSKQQKVEKKEEKIRPDLGYEHIDYDVMFGETENEKMAKRKLTVLFGNEDEKLFEEGETLLDPERVLEVLEGHDQKEEFTLGEYGKSFAEDLGRLFTRIIELPVSSVIDPLKDFLLFNRQYSYCSRCDQILTGDFDEHSAKCETDQECFVEIFHPNMTPANGVRCIDSKCSEKFCSIISLRAHAVTSHGIFVGFEAASSADTRYDHSISDMSKCSDYLKTDKRTNMARFTDAEIGMPISGLLEKNSSFTLPAKTPYQSHRAEAVSKLIRPYVEPKVINYECVWCDFSSNDSIAFQLHVGRNHVFCCDMCGKCFGSKGKMNLHTCTKLFKRMLLSHDLCITGNCKICGQRFPITLLHTHMLKYHFMDVRYSQNTGEILPEGVNMTCEHKPKSVIVKPMGHIDMSNHELRPSERVKLIRSDPNQFRQISTMPTKSVNEIPAPAHAFVFTPPPKRSGDKRLTCYLCGMAYSSTSELDKHLELHPEVWKRCPFNCRAPINGHYDMQRHLLEAHMVRYNGGMTCQFCRTPNPESPCAHLVYHCRRLPNCGICAVRTGSYDSHVAHMAKAHVRDLRRFQCTLCGHIFITMPEFYDHYCKISTSAHSCACGSPKIFASINDYCDHFDTNHVESNFVCGICHIPQHTYDNLAKHRLTHMQPLTSSNLRRLYLLPKWLHPSSTLPKTVPNGPRALPAPAARMQFPSVGAGSLVKRPGGVVISTGSKNMQQALDELLKNASGSKPTPVPGAIDDGDDDDIVFEGTVQNVAKPVKKRASKQSSREISPNTDGMPTLTDSRNDISAQVRIESQDNVENNFGQNQPGYVEDDEIELVSEVQPSAADEVEIAKKKAKIVEVQDENADDDLAVVAEVENVSGVLSSTIAATSREKRFKCTKCSSAFLTNLSLVKHMEAHFGDAGANTSSEIFGIPYECVGHICRSCCLVFEDRKAYETHVAFHGDTQLTCRKCSGIAFNSSIFNQHLKAHDTKTLYYACGSCKMRFFSDLHLMEHLTNVHKVPLFAYCKICGIGSTSMDSVFQHVHTAHYTDYILADRIGVCPAALLNYEPQDVEVFKSLVAANDKVLMKPSDCSHRSLLLTSDPLVSCTTCYCTQSLHSFVAFNKMGELPITFVYCEPRNDLLRVFPLMGELCRNNADIMNRYGQQCTAPPMRAQHTEMTHCSVKTYLKNPRNLSVPNRLTPQLPPARIPPGSRVIRPVQHNVNFGNQASSPIMPNNPGPSQLRVIVPRPGNAPQNGVVQNSRVTTNRPILPHRQPQPVAGLPNYRVEENAMIQSLNSGAPFHVQNNATNLEKCTTCHAIVSTEYDRSKHRMHTLTEHSWFCNMCAASDKDEMGILCHYYQAHLAPLIEQKDESFKPLVFDLKCPHLECRSAQFTTLSAFSKHLHTHSDKMPHASLCCEARFTTKDRQETHIDKHRHYEEENGVDGTCCPLCGTLETWTLPKEKDRSFVLSHVARHGLDYFSTCRFCFVRFQDDTDFTQLFDHYRVKHLIDRQTENKTCACGITELNPKELFAHFKEKHALNVIRKSVFSKEGELVVRAGNTWFNYLGLRRKAIIRESTPVQRKSASNDDVENGDIPVLRKEDPNDNGEEDELKKPTGGIGANGNGNGVIDHAVIDLD